jgi:2-isopropylmalate synthase
VLIDASDKQGEWGSIGVSENLIAASWDALVDSLEYGMQPDAHGSRPAQGADAASASPEDSALRATGGV